MIDFRANAQEIKKMVPNDVDQFWYSIACTQCGHVQTDVRIGLDEYPVEGSTTKVNWVSICPDCKKEMRLKYLTNYTGVEYSNYGKWNPLWEIDCRNCRVDIVGCDNWKVTSHSGQVYDWNSEADFYEFDEGSGMPIGISELDFHVRTL